MNIFELMVIVTHIGGSIAGILASKGHGVFGMITGICTWLLIGWALYLITNYLCEMIGSISEVSVRLTPLQWLGSFTAAFILPSLSMLASLWLPKITVKWIVNF